MNRPLIASTIFAVISVTLGVSTRASGAFLYEADDPAALALGQATELGSPIDGRKPAPIPLLRMNLPGVGIGYRDGSAAYLNPSTVIFTHHFVAPFLGNSPTFTVDIQPDGTFTGEGIHQISHVAYNPSLDLVIGRLASPVAHGPIVEIGPANFDELMMVGGTGETQYVGNSTSFYDKLPRAFYMRAGGLTGGELTLGIARVARDPVGLAINRYSGSAAWNSAGQLSAILDNGVYFPGEFNGSNGATVLWQGAAFGWLQEMIGERLIPGDANADGKVSFDDLLLLAQNYQSLGRTMWWKDADFNGSGRVDFDDLLILAQHYGDGVTLIDDASASFKADWALAQSIVPEPGATIFAFCTGVLVIRRR